MKLPLFTLLFLLSLSASAQEETDRFFTNPGFEEPAPGDDARPYGWMNCYDAFGAPLDLHHVQINTHRTKTAPHEGLGYAGMGLYQEGQRALTFQLLDRPLTPGVTYRIGLRARVPKQYPDNFQVNVNRKSPIRPAMLGVFIGDDFCNTPKMVAVTPPVVTMDWQFYQLEFVAPEGRNRFVGIGITEDPQYPNPYNAYLVVDAVTPIQYVRAPGVDNPVADNDYVRAVNLSNEIRPDAHQMLLKYGQHLVFHEDGETMNEIGLRVLRNVLKQTVYQSGTIELVIRRNSDEDNWKRERWLREWIEDRFPQTENITLRVAHPRENPTRFQYANADFYVRVMTAK